MFWVKASVRHCDVVWLAQISAVLAGQGGRAARIGSPSSMTSSGMSGSGVPVRLLPLACSRLGLQSPSVHPHEGSPHKGMLERGGPTGLGLKQIEDPIIRLRLRLAFKHMHDVLIWLPPHRWHIDVDNNSS